MLTISFTGHRPEGLLGRDVPREAYQKVVDAIFAEAESLADEDGTLFLTGGAAGADQLAFWAVHRLKQTKRNITNRVIIPFRGQELSWPEAGMFGQAEYRKMLLLADSVRYLYDDSSDAKRKLLDRNRYLACHADVLVAVLSDRDPQNLSEVGGGTGYTIREAKAYGARIREIRVAGGGYL